MTFPPSPTPARVRRWAGAAALVAGTLALAACASDDPVPASGETTAPTKEPHASQEPSGEPSEEPTSESPSEPSSTAVPVYFVGDGPGGETRLFREFQRVQGDPLTAAARLLTTGAVEDPDYRTLWPATDLSVTGDDEEILVEVADDAFTERPDGMSARDAELAIQQLVYTLQGVQQARVPVRIVRDGAATRLFGIDTAVPFEAASALRTLNLVNITSPAEGDTVTGDTLTVTGVANSFEASGPCRLLRAGEELVVDGYEATAWADDKLFPFVAALPLAGISGEVVLQCETDDPSGGTEGDGPAVDTKLIHVG